jgi:hypothetical protein
LQIEPTQTSPWHYSKTLAGIIHNIHMWSQSIGERIVDAHSQAVDAPLQQASENTVQLLMQKDAHLTIQPLVIAEPTHSQMDASTSAHTQMVFAQT